MVDGRLNRHVLNNYQQGDIIGDGPILGLIDITAQTVGIMLGITIKESKKPLGGQDLRFDAKKTRRRHLGTAVTRARPDSHHLLTTSSTKVD
jgi:hypothetical protein